MTYLALGSSLEKHLPMALLDTQILIWSLSFFVVLFSQKESWLKYVLLGTTLGGLLATKYFFPIFFLYLGLASIWSFSKKTYIKFMVSLLISLSIYFGSYYEFFSHGHSLIDFIKFEWYRFKWWTGNRTIPKFIILQTILLGKFPMWWEKTQQYQFDGDWNLSWPILFIGHLIALVKQRLNLKSLIVLLYALGLLGVYLFGSAVYGRYLLQLIPFWIIIIGWAGQNVAKKISL